MGWFWAIELRNTIISVTAFPEVCNHQLAFFHCFSYGLLLCLLLPSALEPEIRLTGTNAGQPVIYGDDVSLRCEPVGGIPFPQVSWGSRIPPGAVTVQSGNTVLMTLSDLKADTCVQCVGTSLGGRTEQELCITVLCKKTCCYFKV